MLATFPSVRLCLILGSIVTMLAILAAGSATGAAGAGQPAGAGGAEKLWVFIGTYTGGSKSKGIYRLDYDPATGALKNLKLAAEASEPSFLAVHPTGKFLYACNELSEFKGKKNNGGLSAFAIDAKTGQLKLLNERATGGTAPCYVVCDKAGTHALAANYGGGNACVYETLEDGKLGERTAFVQHTGSGPNKERQEAPHAHSINLDRDNHFAFVADLGLDKIMIYRFDPDKGTLKANTPAFAAVPPGGGPRHFAFHPSGKFAYANSELTLAVTAMAYDAAKGTLKPLQTISTLPEGASKKGASTAEVQVHPSGKFVYVSNRGHDTIAIFSVDAETGKLTAVGHQGKDVKTPRNFCIDPAGKFLIVANQDGDSLVVFAIDQKTGELRPTGHRVEVPRPVCVRFCAVPK